MANRKNASTGLLKVLFLGHLVLTAWGLESPYYVPSGYLFYNLVFMMSLIWALASENVDSASMAFLVNVTSIIMDAFVLVYWPYRTGRERVYFGIAVANTVLRALTALLLHRLFKDRDIEGVGLGQLIGEVKAVFGQNRDRNDYEEVNNESHLEDRSNGGRGHATVVKHITPMQLEV